MIYSKELLKKKYFVIEFEINETLMAASNKVDSNILVSDLNKFVYNLDTESILFNRTYESKYAVGLNKLDLKPKTEDIIGIFLIYFAFSVILILFCIPIFSRIKLIVKTKTNKNNLGILK